LFIPAWRKIQQKYRRDGRGLGGGKERGGGNGGSLRHALSPQRLTPQSSPARQHPTPLLLTRSQPTRHRTNQLPTMIPVQFDNPISRAEEVTGALCWRTGGVSVAFSPTRFPRGAPLGSSAAARAGTETRTTSDSTSSLSFLLVLGVLRSLQKNQAEKAWETTANSRAFERKERNTGEISPLDGSNAPNGKVSWDDGEGAGRRRKKNT